MIHPNALERIQATGQSRVLDGLFVANQAEAGELAAIDLRSSSAASAVARLLSFRLDDRVVRELGGSLTPGGAMLGLLIQRPGWKELGDAVARTGGWMLSAELVRSASLAELAPKLLAALSSSARPAKAG